MLQKSLMLLFYLSHYFLQEIWLHFFQILQKQEYHILCLLFQYLHFPPFAYKFESFLKYCSALCFYCKYGTHPCCIQRLRLHLPCLEGKLACILALQLNQKGHRSYFSQVFLQYFSTPASFSCQECSIY